MATVNFTGNVSAQAAEGETVTISVTKPDTTQEVTTAQTLPDKTFSAQMELPPSTYSAVASVEADAVYKAAISSTVPFTVGLEDRSITLNISVIS